jgi:anionic cell wall polymer biosynthesis LytR-Cps2A-Psr (LCP) family protein
MIALVVIALLLVTAGFGYFKYQWGQILSANCATCVSAASGAPYNLLLIGSDSRAGETAAQAVQFGSTSIAGGQRADTIKVVHVDPAAGTASTLSIPRDTFVAITGLPANTQLAVHNKINASFAGGPDAGLVIPTAGCQVLNGKMALSLSRSRFYQYYANGYWHSDPSSDLGRIQRQNLVIASALNKAKSTYNPLRLNSLLTSVVHDFSKDDNLSVGDLLALAQRYHGFSGSALTSFTLPTVGAVSSYVGDVEVVQPEAATVVLNQFLNGPLGTIVTPPVSQYGNPLTLTVPTTSPTAPVATTAPSTPGKATAPTPSKASTAPAYDPTPC